MKFPIKKILNYLILRLLNPIFIQNPVSNKTKLKAFQKIGPNQKILIVAPHPDDEIISCGGLIQRMVKNKAKIKIIYISNGENNLISLISQIKHKQPLNETKLSKKRISEAKNATKILGVNSNNLIFLGYPDSYIKNIYSKKHFLHKNQKQYTKTNLVKKLKQIITKYQPNIIITPHPKDKDPDHQATTLFVQKIIKNLNSKPQLYTYLIHYPFYPSSKKIQINTSIFPPQKLYQPHNWYSLELSQQQKQNKLTAVNQNQSQISNHYSKNFLTSFIKKNEIFQHLNY